MERTNNTISILTESCLSKFEQQLNVEHAEGFGLLERRLADFRLWSDGVGALAKPGVSLDFRLRGREKDIVLVKTVLTMLADSLDYYASFAKSDARCDESIAILDSAIQNLALIGTAIRRTGRASRNRRADQTFHPDEHQELRNHLQCVILLRPTRNALFDKAENERYVSTLDMTCLTGLQERLIEANLRRRHKFLRAQRKSMTQEEAPTNKRNILANTTTTGSTGGQDLTSAETTIEVQDATLKPIAKRGRHATPTVSGTSLASTAEGTLKYSSAPRKYSSGPAKTQITSIASDAEFPQAPSVALDRELSRCPCCCQALPSKIFRDPVLWKQHVIEDLCPYTCIAKNCPTPQLLFCTRSEWESHVKKSHLPHWQCPFCEEQVEDYATMESMGSHIQSKHELELLETPLSTILSWSAVQKMGITHCPLCSSQGPEDSPELVDHILWHAYDFALRALPWPFPVSHDLNSPPGEFNFPEDTARATNLQSWIDGKIIYESREQLELELSQYDRANHCPSVPVDVSGYSGYFQRNPYFDDSPDDRSSKPQGNQSKPSHHSNAYFEEPIEESERPLHNSKVTIKGIREGAEDHLMSEDEPSNASGYVVQHPDDMVEGEDLEQQLGACFAGYTSTEQPHLQETDIRKIADILLRHSKMSWSKIPRIYSILRIIGHLEYIELFVKQGLTDYCVPFLKSCLPSQMAPQHKAAFFQAQQLVFNSNLIIASEAAVHHCHFQDEDEVPLESVGHLGQGFRSQVDQVRSFITGKDFARKRLNRTTKRFTESQQSFEAELAIRKRISEKHTHLPIFCNSYTLPYETAILMSPIADYRLDEYLRQDRENVQEEILWTLFGCLSSTLHFLHISFIWHKDVKPHNVLLKKEKIVLVGFGHALDWSELEDDQESGPPDAMTRRYAAPEVISHEERSSLTDVWSLGCIFLEIWTVLNGKSLGDMKSYLESGTDNLSCYADNLDRIDLWITHIQELSDNKVDKAPAEWIRNMLTPDQHARWSARTLFDAINQHGGRYIGECCRVRGNTQETSETYDTAESDPVSQERVWTDLDQEREDNLAESEPPDTEQIASASHSVPQKHSSLPQHTLYQTSSRPPSYTSLNEIDPGVTDVVPSPSTVQQQSKPSSPAIPDTESKVGSPLSLKVTTEPTTGRSSVRRWLDRAGAYIGTKEPVKKSYRYPMVPGEDLRNEDLQRTAEQYESLRRQRTRSPAPSIRSLEQPKSEGLLTPMPLPEQDDEERLRREHLARQAKDRERVRRNREEAERMEAEWQAEQSDKFRRERDELRRELDPRPRDGS